jgi:hypothetical protein
VGDKSEESASGGALPRSAESRETCVCTRRLVAISSTLLVPRLTVGIFGDIGGYWGIKTGNFSRS